MTGAALYLVGALALTGQSRDAEGLEESIREALVAQGIVQQVEMSPLDENRMSGFAIVRREGEIQGRRLACTAERDPSKGTAYYGWHCQPEIDETTLTDVENAIREELSSQGRVEEVEMRRRDDDNMIGFARVRDRAGTRVRFDCTAARDPGDGGNFDWRCLPPGGG